VTLSLRCGCGRLAGEIVDPRDSWHVVCYCRDCQAYAHALGQPQEVLDEHGGTHIVAVRPRQVHITRGREVLSCVSLAPGGLLRWYAGCCGTPLAHTPRDPHTPYVGLVHSALADSPAGLERTYGPVRYRANRRGARGRAPANPAGSTVALAGILFALFRGRYGGSWRLTPFFEAGTSKPVARPRVLSPEQLQRVRAAVASGAT